VENLGGLNVLVTGANGFLGRHLIDRLSGHKARIYAVSRKTPPSADGVRWVQGDLANGDWLLELVASITPDVIYQLVSASQGGQDSQFVHPTFEQTFVGLLSCNAAKAH
jgi:nucleoside-diphosphate-sugar epimerase